MATRFALDELVNGAGIADRLGVSDPTVANWRARHDDFPAPLDVPGVVSIPLYHWPAVKAWHDSRKAQ